jgi:hypothetical protein
MKFELFSVPVVSNNSQETLFAVEGEDSFERVHFSTESNSLKEIDFNPNIELPSIDTYEEIPDLDEYCEENLIIPDDPVN